MPGPPRALHRFAALLAGCVLVLIAAGAVVKSKEAGLSVPDWPLSYGGLNPPRWWQIETVRAEHGHRLIAGTVALLTLGLAVWAQRREPRRRVRRLAWAAFGAVLVQALLGGLTVLWFLPPAVSVAHAGMAQLFLCLVVAVAVVTAPGWRAGGEPDAGAAARLRRPATLLAVLVYLQILLGAVVRHLGAGLAIPDFPLVFGGLVPPRLDLGIAVHYAHRLGALLVVVVAARVVAGALRAGAGLARTAALLVPLLLGQVLLGGAIVWTGRAELPNSLHVVVGAAVLAVSLVVALATWRDRLGDWLSAEPLATREGDARRGARPEPAAS